MNKKRNIYLYLYLYLYYLKTNSLININYLFIIFKKNFIFLIL